MKPNALLVDDDEAFVKGLAEAVKLEGFDVRTAGTLHDARVALREQDADALIVDMQLPDGSGLTLLQTPEGKLPPGVIFISGTSSVELAYSVTPRTLTMSTAWWATTARPDSDTMVGWGMPCSSHISIIAYTMSLAYSWMV